MWPAAVQAWNVADLAGRGFDVSDHDIAAELHSDVENESAYSSDDEVLGFEALVEQSDRLADEVDNLHSEHVQQLPAHEPGMWEAGTEQSNVSVSAILLPVQGHL